MKNAILLPKHHSPDDWEFSTDFWELSPVQFISPPTSLHETINSGFLALCKYPTTLCIPDGEIRSHFYLHHGRFDEAALYFRQQKPVDNPSPASGYFVRLTWAACTLFSSWNGTVDRIGAWPWNTPYHEWCHVRVKFWSQVGGAYDGQLAVDLFIEEAGHWVNAGPTVYDPHNRYKDSLINRLGVELTYAGYTDDTEICA